MFISYLDLISYDFLKCIQQVLADEWPQQLSLTVVLVAVV